MRQALSRGSYARVAHPVLLPERRRTFEFRRIISLANPGLWMAAAFITAFILSATVILTVGANQRGIDDALLLTGRVSFILFWPAYAGSAAAALFGSAFDFLKRQGRNFGLAFASAHIIHLGLVAWLCYVGAAPPIASFVLFGIAVAWTYLLAIVSIPCLRQTIRPWQWRLISFLGLNYIAFAFAHDFMRFPFNLSVKYLIGYVPFIVLAVGGFALRAGAWAARLVRTSSVHIDR